MSAANSSLSDREHEALRRAQRAHEPSMEEILASIRTIIAEEREPLKPEPAHPVGAAVKPSSPAPAPQVVHLRDEPDASRAPATSPQGPAPSAAASQPGQPSPGAQRAPAAETATGSVDVDRPLVSPETGKAVGSAFNALSASLATRSAELAEEMARDMLRPMLKTWLDENLPGIVERLVRVEIERISRGSS
jgi:cell pole-organizing protein PopZ